MKRRRAKKVAGRKRVPWSEVARSLDARLLQVSMVVDKIRAAPGNCHAFHSNYSDMLEVFKQLREKDDEYRAELFRQSQRINTLERNLLDPLLKKKARR